MVYTFLSPISYLTRCITLAKIFSKLSPLSIFLKNVIFYSSYFVSKIATSKFKSFIFIITHITQDSDPQHTLLKIPPPPHHPPLELMRIYVKNVIFYWNLLIFQRIGFKLQLFIPYYHPHHIWHMYNSGNNISELSPLSTLNFP